MTQKKSNKEKDKIIAITSKVDKIQLKELDKYAKKLRITRSQMIRNCLDDGIEDLKLLERTGLLGLAIKGVDTLALIKTALHKDKYEFKDNGKLVIDL